MRETKTKLNSCSGGSSNTYVESVVAFVFSVEDVFSYSVVDRLGIMPPALGPTVRLPLLGSNLPAAVLVVRGFAGLEIDAAGGGKRRRNVS